MTNLSPVGTPAGFPNTMSDIVDSLKRLERIGDENSKTVDKILTAARAIEKMIAAQYKSSKQAFIDGSRVLDSVAKDGGYRDRKQAATELGVDCDSAEKMNYRIEWSGYDYGLYRQISTYSGNGLWKTTEESVSNNREVALQFAADLAKGLLKLIEYHQIERKRANDAGLAALVDVEKALKGQNQQEE